jgi:hypothetical protein
MKDDFSRTFSFITTASVGAALARTTDRTTRVHLEGLRDQIAKILNPNLAGVAEIVGQP